MVRNGRCHKLAAGFEPPAGMRELKRTSGGLYAKGVSVEEIRVQDSGLGFRGPGYRYHPWNYIGPKP